MFLEELKKELRAILMFLKEYRESKAEARTAEKRTEMQAKLERAKALEIEIKEAEEALDLEKRMSQTINQPAGFVPPTGLDGEGRAQVPDQPVYKGSPAAALGQQLMDIRATSPGSPHSVSMVSEARSRLEQAEKRYMISLENQARKENRAAATGGLQQAVGADGGYFLQGETAIDLMTHGFNNSVVLPKTASRTLSDGTQYVEIIGIDEQSRTSGNRGGGVTVYTSKELGELTASKPKFNKIRIEPDKLIGHYVASNEILRNVTFLGQEMRQLFGEEFAYKAQDLVFTGSGAGEAMGIMNAPAKVSVAKETGQKADTILTENILAMEQAIDAERPGLAYFINRECKKQLSVLTLAAGTAGVFVPLFKEEFNQGVRQSTLNGLPCYTIEQCKKLGDEGDIILADFSQYITCNKGDINEAMSIHVYFLYDQSAFRFIYFFGGTPRWLTSVTPANAKSGTKVSPFVTLAAR